MLTISAFRDDLVNPLNKTTSTKITESDLILSRESEQKEADEFIQRKINKIINKDQIELENEKEDTNKVLAQRRFRRALWKNIFSYIKTGGLLTIHFAGVYAVSLLSKKLLPDREIMSSKRKS